MNIKLIRNLTWTAALIGGLLIACDQPTWSGSTIFTRHIGALLTLISIWIQAICEFICGEITMPPIPVKRTQGDYWFKVAFVVKLFFGTVFLMAFRQ